MDESTDPRNLALLREGEFFDGTTLSTCPVCHWGILIIREKRKPLTDVTGWAHLGRRLVWFRGRSTFTSFCRNAHCTNTAARLVVDQRPDTPSLRAYFT